MRPTTYAGVLALLTVAFTGTAAAQTTATQTVTFEVQAINQVSVSGDPGALTITTASGGSPTAVTDATTTYTVTTNTTGAKITGSIDSAMPSGVTLKTNLTAPTNGTSAGAVALGTVAADLVTGITELSETKAITYTLEATLAAGKVASSTRTVTFTIVTGA